MKNLIDLLKKFQRKEEKSGVSSQDILTNMIKLEAFRSNGQLKLI